MSTLSLRSAAINDEEARKLAGLIARASELTELDLRDNSIGDTGGRALVHSIAQHPALAKVDLRDNPLSDEVEQQLNDAVRANARLTFVETSSALHREERIALLCENRDALNELSASRRRAVAPTDAVRAALDEVAASSGRLDQDARFRAWGDGIARLLRRRARESRSERAPKKPPPKVRAKTPPAKVGTLWQGHLCYVCKSRIESPHPRYNLMCEPCGDLNLSKRECSVDLSGRTFVLTGARTKIGLALGLRLLRSGAHLVATTRFPADCARTYADALDDGIERLEVHALDLRDLHAVEAFGARIRQDHEGLDGLINLAAQTVWRPPQQYAHLFPIESQPVESLPERWRHVVKSSAPASLVKALEPHMRKLLPAGALHEMPLELAPLVDDRETNSWRLTLSEVETRELVEVQVVNAVAPFVLTRELLPLLRAKSGPRWIINVSAVEGQFYRRWKGNNHPHCNMAKSALNMFVRTIAADLAKEEIYVSAVDTGWVSNDNPLPIKERMDQAGFALPIDVEDGAARVYDPIARSLLHDDHMCGVFLKDYAPAPW